MKDKKSKGEKWKKTWEKICIFFKELIRIYIFNKEGWKYVAISLIGNLFPIWVLLIPEFANNGFNHDSFIRVISQPYTYIILSVTFASTTMYLWMKKIKLDNEGKGDIPVMILIYSIILFPIVGYLLNKKDELENYIPHSLRDPAIGIEDANTMFIVKVVYCIITLVILLYIRFQLRDFAEIKKVNKISGQNISEKNQAEITKLSNEL